MKKTIVIFVFGLSSRIPKNWLDSFKKLEVELSETKTAKEQKVKFCFIRSFFLDDEILFSSRGDRSSSSGKGVNLFLKDKVIQQMIIGRLIELGEKKTVIIEFHAGSGFHNFTGNIREDMPAKTI